MVIRIGAGVPGRRRIPRWIDTAAYVGRVVLAVLLGYAVLWPASPPADSPRWTYETSAR